MKFYSIIPLIGSALIIFTVIFASLAQQPPGPKAGHPVPIPKGTNVSNTAPPMAQLGPVHTISLPGGVTITVTATNKFNRAQLQRWLMEARTVR